MTISPIKRVIAVTVVVLIVAGMLGCGHVVTKEDPIKKADAIYVLGGSWIDRWLEGADLYAEGMAPHIVISNGTFDDGARELERRGIRFSTPGALSAAVMVEQMKIPKNAIDVIARSLDNTAQEALAIKTFVDANHWKSIIVITDRASTRRAGFAMRRVLGPDVDVIMRGARLDHFSPDGWWRKRATFRTVFYEFPKLIAYWFGLKG